MVNHNFIETFDHWHMRFNPPVPPLRVLDLVLKLWLDSVVHSIAKACVRRKNIKWVPDNHDALVAAVMQSVWYDQWMMSFGDPDSVVDHILTLQPLDLEASCCVQMHRAACRNSRDLLKASSEERIARPWETREADSVIVKRATVHESEITVPNPFHFVK